MATDNARGAAGTTHTRTWIEFVRTYAPRFSACFFGLIAVRIWIQCCLYDRYSATDFGMLTIVGNGARIILIVVLIFAASRQGFSNRAQKALSWFSVTAMTLASVLYLLQTEMPSLPLSMTACVLGGLGIVWGGGLWIRFFARLEPGEALIYTFAALGLSSLAGLVIGLFPLQVAYSISIFMPTLSLVSYWQAMHRLDERRESVPEPLPDALYDSEPKSVVARLLIGVGLLEFALGIARGFPFGESILLPLPFQVFHQLGALALSIGMIWWVLVCGRGLRFSSVWRLQVLLMVAGVIMLTTMMGSLVPWGAAFITLSNTFMLGVLWYCAYDWSRHSSMPSYVVLGAVWVVHLLPRDLGRWGIFVLQPNSMANVLIIAALVCLLALSLAFILYDSIPKTRPLFAEFALSSRTQGLFAQKAAGAGCADESGQARLDGNRERLSPQETCREGSSLEERCLALQTAYGLTDRETDIVRYLAQGRTRGFISRKLFISENTVKSYTRTMYQKLDIHSKQSLIDTLESIRL